MLIYLYIDPTLGTAEAWLRLWKMIGLLCRNGLRMNVPTVLVGKRADIENMR